MNDTMLHLGVTILQHTVPESGDIEVKLRAVMSKAQDEIWFTTDPDVLFRCAVGAVMAHYGQGSEEFERLAHELQTLRLFSAGIMAHNLDALVAHQENGPAPVGIMRIWRETNPPSSRPPRRPSHD